jgi:hypothetical protein
MQHPQHVHRISIGTVVDLVAAMRVAADTLSRQAVREAVRLGELVEFRACCPQFGDE